MLRLLALLGFVGVALTAVVARKEGEIVPNLHVIGTADGKSFFATTDGARNWETAGIYCQSIGMELGAPITPGQLRLWEEAYNPSIFYGTFWTAGRDANTFEQFVWNGTQVKPPGDAKWQNNAGVQSCVQYLALSDGPVFLMNSCRSESGAICMLSV